MTHRHTHVGLSINTRRLSALLTRDKRQITKEEKYYLSSTSKCTLLQEAQMSLVKGLDGKLSYVSYSEVLHTGPAVCGCNKQIQQLSIEKGGSQIHA